MNTPPPRPRRWRLFLLLIALVLPGTASFGVCMYYAVHDWAALQSAYTHFERIASTASDQRTLFIAEAKQNIHRINLFADVVWALLSAIVAAIGLHGICIYSDSGKSA